MKKLFLLSAIIFTLPVSAQAASSHYAAKKELEGWSVAAKQYEETCHAGKLRQQMPRNKAVPAYDCFAKIIDAAVELQYPDLYAKLDKAMKEAHESYGNGKSDWPATLKKLAAASDEYNAAVAKRNAQGNRND